MFSIGLNHSVAALVENLLPKEEGFKKDNKGDWVVEKALYVRLHLFMRNPETDKRCSEFAHFIFCRKMGSVMVFFARGDWQVPKTKDFRMTSDHDTCWRSDGFRDLDQLYFDMADSVRGIKPPVDMQETNFIDYVDVVPLTYNKDPDDKWGHKKKLEKIGA